MKKTLVPMLAVVAMLSLALTLFASQEPRPQARPEDAPQLVSATIKQVDTTGSTVMVETADKQQGTFTVDSQTKMTVNGKNAKLSDLKEGQQVKIAFNSEGKALSIDA
jgi:Cu/Ag efflux protein CusF